MMGCAGGCPNWCECVDGTCTETSSVVNALRLHTADGRYLGALPGVADDALVAVATVPGPNETFRVLLPWSPPPTFFAFPLQSGDQITLAVCTATWTLQTPPKVVRGSLTLGPPDREQEQHQFFAGFGHLSASQYSQDLAVDTPLEKLFTIAKVGGSVGPRIASGDIVALSGIGPADDGSF